MSLWSGLLIVGAVGFMTYAMRAVVIVAMAKRPIPPAVEVALRSVGPAVLAALAINLAAGGEGGPSLEVAEGAALVVAGAVAWWRKNLIACLVAGMATLWVVSALL